MRKLILLILMTLKSATIGASTETYICSGSEETYHCKLYTGGDLIVYTYPKPHDQEYGGDIECDDADYDDPVDGEDSDEEIADIEKADLIPQAQQPTYVNPFTGTFFIPVQVKK